MAGELARAIEGIPVVTDQNERDAKFGTPMRDQRVQYRASGAIQRHTGTAWVYDSLGTGGGISVKDYGAVGDGVADDTTSTAAAITAASSLTHAAYNLTFMAGSILQGDLLNRS